MDTRAFAFKAVPLLALIFAGILILVLGGHGTTTVIVGSTIEGLAAIFLVSLLFYEVGRSEDRQRERDRLRR